MIAKTKSHVLFLIVLALLSSCGGPTGTSGSDKFEGVPSGEIVPVEKRDSVLTGVAFMDSQSKSKGVTKKWWLQKVSKIDYRGCTGYEDEEITSEDTYYAFAPDGGYYGKVGESGSEQKLSSWEWSDESKSAIVLEKFPDVVFEIRALNEEEVIYASLQPQTGGCEVVTWEQFGEPIPAVTDGGDGQGSTSITADFSMVIEGPIGTTGMYLDEVDIEFNNRSTNSAVDYEWCWSSYEDGSGCEVFSTDSDPSYTFPLENDPFYSDSSYVTVILKAWAEDGSVSTMKKRHGFRMLEGLGTVTIDGEVHEVDDITYVNGSELVCGPQGYPLPDNRPPYTEIVFDEIHFYGAPEPLTLRLAGEGDILTLTPMYSTAEEYPVMESSPPNRRTFFLRWNQLSSHTYEDPDNIYSSGGTSNNAFIIDRNDVIEAVEASFETDNISIDINIRHIPHYATIYPDYWDPEGDCRF